MVTNIYDLKGKLVIKKSLSGNVKQSVKMKGRLTNGIGTGGAKAEFGTTEFWNEQIDYIPSEGTFIVYTDHIVIGNVPYLGVKIGDGVNLLSELKFISEGELHQLSVVAFSGSYDDLTDVPTKLSQFSDDVGYLTEETDPTVPSWAKEPHKPTYTADEVGALPSDTPLFDGDYNSLSNKPELFDGDYNKLSNKPTIPNVPNWAMQQKKPSYTAQEVGALPDTTPLFDGDYNKLTNKPTIPTKTTQLENDNGFITNDDLTEYAKESFVLEETGKLDEKIDDLMLFKFPNANIVGQPLVENGNISRFSASDYLIFPFVVDVKNNPFVITMCFTTGNDVNTQQNILDSYFGMALAIQNGRGIMALSSNGTGWDIGLVTGVIPIYPNRTYYAKVSWDGSAYKTALSDDGVTYVNDMYAATSVGLNPTTMYIGASPNIFGAGSSHPFGGTINLNKCHLSVAGLEVWQGMDDAGLSTRADLSLGNLDAEGEKRFTERYTRQEADAKFALKTELPTVPTNVSEFANDAGYLTQHQSLEGYATESFVSDEFARQLALIDGNGVAY